MQPSPCHDVQLLISSGLGGGGLNSKNHLVLSARECHALNSGNQAYNSELKMEKRKSEREPVRELRQSKRERSSVILQPDAIPTRSVISELTSQPRLNSTRPRLREDTAQKSKARANNFLVANKSLLLPLLPEDNEVSKLAEKGIAQFIVHYEELTKQLSDLSFLVFLYNNGFSGILGDKMGLGKTLQTLSLFQYPEELDRKQDVRSEEIRPYLVVFPLSILNSWVSEARRWVPRLRVLRFHGASTERARLKRFVIGIEDMKDHDTSQPEHSKTSKEASQKPSNPYISNHAPDPYKILVTAYETFQAEQS